MVVIHQVFDALIVAATEGSTILVTIRAGDGWVAVFIAVFYVGSAMVFEVLAGSFDAIVIAATAYLPVFGGRGVPSAVVALGWALRHQ